MQRRAETAARIPETPLKGVQLLPLAANEMPQKLYLQTWIIHTSTLQRKSAAES